MTTAAPDAPAPAPAVDDEVDQVARAYAEALLGAAGKGDEVETVVNELEEFDRDVLRANPRFAELLASTTVSAEAKERILKDAFEGRALPTVLRFLQVLNRHGRLGLIGPVAREARALWDRKQNRRPVAVRSAVGLDEGQKAALTARVAAMIGATPIVSYQIDPALIGGLVLQVGDDLYDASLRTKLEQMRRRLIANRAGGAGSSLD